MVNKGLAKLRNIVPETVFLVMFPRVAKLGNICFGRKICVREAKMFLTPGKNICCFRAEKFVFRQKITTLMSKIVMTATTMMIMVAAIMICN